MDDPQSPAPDPSRAVTRPYVFDPTEEMQKWAEWHAVGRRTDAEDTAEDERRAAELARAISAVSLPAVKR